MIKMIKKAHDSITRIKGKDYAPTSNEIQEWIDNQNIFYSKNDVLRMLRSFHTLEINVELCMLKLTPIELPSDEEIEKYLKSFPYTKHLDDGQYNDGVIVGAELAIEWMRSKLVTFKSE